VFVNETGRYLAMVLEWGWGPRGERVRGTVPQGHGQTSTLVLALRQAGLVAPMVTAGAMTGPLLLASVKALLCPALAEGNLVIWDNLSAHSVAGVREAIEARGATLQPRPPAQRISRKPFVLRPMRTPRRGWCITISILARMSCIFFGL
jgi:hypothetical protein